MGGRKWRQCFQEPLFKGRRENVAVAVCLRQETAAYLWGDRKYLGEEGRIEAEGERVGGVTAKEQDLLLPLLEAPRR